METLEPLVWICEFTPIWQAAVLLDASDPGLTLSTTFGVDVRRGVGSTESGAVVMWTREGRRVTRIRHYGTVGVEFHASPEVDPDAPEPGGVAAARFKIAMRTSPVFVRGV